ncbi:MAG TPA: cytochrome d ubiquinol oxidase subunit II [Caldilineaceae bacterium]|nr:cytochrome d ubiquinol oxidase subunit II [Caldilineaceae bacterium]
MLPELTLNLIIATVTVVALILYAVLAGADFGGGMWDLLAFGPRARQQREAIADAIGPVWEANHVWLILVIVLLFTAYPPAFAAIMTALHIPITVVLIGIVLRGSAFVFRKYDAQDDATHRRWSAVFSISSFLTPLFLGMTLGGLASGDIRVEGSLVATGFFAGWTSLFAIACGLFAQGLFAFLAATYMTVETAHNPELQSDFRLRALISGLSLAPAAALVFVLARYQAPELFAGSTHWWSDWIFGLTSIAAFGALGALWWRRFHLARIAAVVQVTMILSGWALAQFPALIMPDVTIYNTVAPEITLRLLVIALAAGAVILLPSLGYLFYVFKRE